MLRLLLCLLVLVSSLSAAEALEAPRPLPRICRADDQTLICISPFVSLRSDPERIYLAGEIRDDAPANFLRILRAVPTAKTLLLYSEGGYIDPALLLAQEVHRRGIGTEIAEDGFCYSSCAYVFLAGVRRIVRGALGVHQVYNGLASSVQSQQGFADVFSLMREFGVADRVITLMLATPPDDIHIFTTGEIADLGIETTPRGTRPAEQGRLPSEGSKTLALIEAKPAPGELSPALLLEASEDGRTGAVPFSGKVTWLKGVDPMGSPTIQAHAEFPGRGFGVHLVFRRDSNEPRPGSLIVEARFEVTNSFAGGSVAGFPGVLLKNEELVQGQPLIGSSARVAGNSFLFAGSPNRQDEVANAQLLSSRKWIDLALIYATGRRAIVTLEKDDRALQTFVDVIAAWRSEDAESP